MNDWVEISMPDNRPDRNGKGCVPYIYEMATYALTNKDWCDFLNAVGQEAVTAHKLYHKDMTTGILGGIDCADGSYTPKAGWEKKPVVYVTYTSLLRYCNWRQTGDTESGAYDLTTRPPRRLVGGRYFLPTDDEWYKAAYFDPRAKRYWLYPTCSNDLPSQDAANYEKGDAFAKGPPYYLADVDDYADTPSPWGVVQMGGNAWEYLEDTWMINGQLANKLRGGSFGYTETGLASTNTDAGKYDRRCYVFGARLAHSPDGWHPVKKPFKYAVWMKLKRYLHFLHFLHG